MTITTEMKQALETAGHEPVRLEDPDTKIPYLIIREDVYLKMSQSLAMDHSNKSLYEVGEFHPSELSEGMRLAQDAFFRDLPSMLGDRTLKGKWVLYHRDKRIAAASKERDLLKEVNRLHIPGDEYGTFIVCEQSREPEEVDFPSSWQ